MLHMNDAQARAYIQGEAPFDAEQYEREHVERLCKSVRANITEYGMTDEQKQNLIRTVSHYIELHKQADNIDLLHNILREVQNT